MQTNPVREATTASYIIYHSVFFASCYKLITLQIIVENGTTDHNAKCVLLGVVVVVAAAVTAVEQPLLKPNAQALEGIPFAFQHPNIFSQFCGLLSIDGFWIDDYIYWTL
jgi:hypothetical protein